MRTEVTGVIEENDRVVGIRANTPDRTLEVRADLVVGADGRNSVVRASAGLTVENVGASMDSLQLHLSKRADDPRQFLYSDRGKTMVTASRAATLGTTAAGTHHARVPDAHALHRCGFPAPST